MHEAVSHVPGVGDTSRTIRRAPRPAMSMPSSIDVRRVARRSVEQATALSGQRTLTQAEWSQAWDEVIRFQEQTPSQEAEINAMKARLIPHYPLLIRAQGELEQIRRHRDAGLLGEMQLAELEQALEHLEEDVRGLEPRSGPIHQIDAYLRRLHMRLDEEKQILERGKRERVSAVPRLNQMANEVMRPRRARGQDQIAAGRLLEETRKQASRVRAQLIQRLGLPRNEAASVLLEIARGTYRLDVKTRFQQKMYGLQRWFRREPALPSLTELVTMYHKLSREEDEFMAVKHGQKQADPNIIEERWWQE